jgi:hypothetical protein
VRVGDGRDSTPVGFGCWLAKVRRGYVFIAAFANLLLIYEDKLSWRCLTGEDLCNEL